MCKDSEMRESKLGSANKARIFNTQGKALPLRAQNQERAQLTKAPSTNCVSGGQHSVRQAGHEDERLSLHMSDIWNPTKPWQS